MQVFIEKNSKVDDCGIFRIKVEKEKEFRLIIVRANLGILIDAILLILFSKESCPVRPTPAYKAGLYGLTENRQLSNSNTKPPFIPVHRTGHSGCFSKFSRRGFV